MFKKICCFLLVTLVHQFSFSQGGGILPPSLVGPPSKSPIQTNIEFIKDTGNYEQQSVNILFRPKPNGWFLSSDYNNTKLGDSAITLEDGTKVDQSLESLQLRTGYSFLSRNNSEWAVMFGYGSNSDQLFKDSDDNTIQASVIRVSKEAKGRWISGAFFNNNLSIGFPILPVFAYLYQPSKKFRLMIGVPFLNLNIRSDSGLNFFLLLTPGNARAELSQSIKGPIAVFSGAEWATENYQHVNRTSNEEQFFIERNNIFLGLRTPVYKGLMLKGLYGYRSNSKYFQAEGIFDDAEKKFNLQNSGYFALNLFANY
jgi:hypothetical protein